MPEAAGLAPGSALAVTLLRRDRLVVACGLLLVVVLSWAYLLTGAGTMQEMEGMLMPMSAGPWTAGHAAIMLAMWVVMMAAMMLPSAAPMILLYAGMAHRHAQRQGRQSTATGIFALGYVSVWTAFSIAAVALQFAMERAALLSPMMETTSVSLAGTVLIVAGIYQWTPLKQACLRHCRSPLDFMLSRWRPGPRGAFTMGLSHGLTCVGCCWMMMLLLFIGGVMNLAWISGIAIFVLVEKMAPAGHWLGRLAGLGLVAWGLVTLRTVT